MTDAAEGGVLRQLEPGRATADILELYEGVDRTGGRDGSWVLANMVAGLDGCAAAGGRVGPLSTGADVELFRSLRAVADVVLVGASTVRAERYGPVALPDVRRQARVASGRPGVPSLAIVSGSLDLDWGSSAFTEAPADASTVVVTSARADAEKLRVARRHCDVLVAGEDRVDLLELLALLRGRGLRTVLCEGGPSLLGEVVEAGLLDELCLTIAPVMGGDPLPVAVTSAGAPMAHFELAHAASDGASLFLRYERAAASR